MFLHHNSFSCHLQQVKSCGVHSVHCPFEYITSWLIGSVRLWGSFSHTLIFPICSLCRCMRTVLSENVFSIYKKCVLQHVWSHHLLSPTISNALCCGYQSHSLGLKPSAPNTLMDHMILCVFSVDGKPVESAKGTSKMSVFKVKQQRFCLQTLTLCRCFMEFVLFACGLSESFLLCWKIGFSVCN